MRIDAAALMTVLRQCAHASTALKRLGGHFFPAVAGFFDVRMEHHTCELLDVALLTFHAELGRYDWVPSTALTGSSSASATAAAGQAATGAPGWLHPQALELTRHRPLAVFTNDLVQVFNELRQCPLHALRGPVVRRVAECLTNSIALLRQTRSSASALLQAGTPKAAEFTRLCRHFADILVPLMAALLETVFGNAAKLDVAGLVDSMAPDLVPPEAEFPLLADGEEVSPPMAPAVVLAPAPAAAAEATGTEPAVETEAVSQTAAVDQPSAQVAAEQVATGAQEAQQPAVGTADLGVVEGAAASIRDAVGSAAPILDAAQTPLTVAAPASGGYPAAAPTTMAPSGNDVA